MGHKLLLLLRSKQQVIRSPHTPVKTQTSIFTLALQQCPFNWRAKLNHPSTNDTRRPAENNTGDRSELLILDSDLMAPHRSNDTEYENGPVAEAVSRGSIPPRLRVVWVSDICPCPPQFRFTTGRRKMCRLQPHSNS